MGRKPKPTTLKVVQGTFRPDRHTDGEPLLPSVENKDIQCPSYLSDRARRVFKDLRELLSVDMKVLTKVDKHALILLADAWDEYMEARKDCIKNGSTYEVMDDSGNINLKTNPASYIRDKSWKRIVSLLSEFGCTPASRTKVKQEIEQKESSFDQPKTAKNW
jgi:P27 family predicted phage terminase small subunit